MTRALRFVGLRRAAARPRDPHRRRRRARSRRARRGPARVPRPVGDAGLLPQPGADGAPVPRRLARHRRPAPTAPAARSTSPAASRTSSSAAAATSTRRRSRRRSAASTACARAAWPCSAAPTRPPAPSAWWCWPRRNRAMRQRRRCGATRCRARCVAAIGEPADEIVLAPPHSVLKTSSGKVRRSACREAYEAGRIGAAVPTRAPAGAAAGGRRAGGARCDSPAPAARDGCSAPVPGCCSGCWGRGLAADGVPAAARPRVARQPAARAAVAAADAHHAAPCAASSTCPPGLRAGQQPRQLHRRRDARRGAAAAVRLRRQGRVAAATSCRGCSCSAWASSSSTASTPRAALPMPPGWPRPRRRGARCCSFPKAPSRRARPAAVSPRARS